MDVFGLIAANPGELTQQEQTRYNGVYCGICRAIRDGASNLCRLGLSYDMAFLALLHMSLYEPEETGGSRACILHPVKPKPWVDNDAVRYAGDMNVALAYYNCVDDWQDDRNLGARVMADAFGRHSGRVRQQYPRQWEAIDRCITELNRLEAENCPNPAEPANCFGTLMGELLVWREDLWAETLRQMGYSLGRFIYLADAAVDYRRDAKKKRYNPFLAMGTGEDPARWEEYLVLAMARCTGFYERLPLVRDKGILDNILYSGVWVNYRRRQKESQQEDNHD